MATSNPSIPKVRAHFVQGMSLPAAAKLCGVSYQTARNWKRKAKEDGDCWDNARAARRMSGSGMKEMTEQILEEMSVQFMSTLNALKNKDDMEPAVKADILARLSDSYIKTMNAASKGNPGLSALSIAMDMLRDLSLYIGTNFPQLREPFIEVIDGFGPELAKKYG
jgi:transposase